MSTSRSILRNGLIILAVFIASVPAAELCYRWAGAGPSEDFEGLYRPFGQSGYRMNADLHTTADLFHGLVNIYTDGLGLRCGADRRTAIAPGDSVAYLFLGDSQGFGNGVDFERSIAGEFAYRAVENGLSAANVSIGGHYLRNQLELASWLTDEQGVAVDRIVLLATPRLMFKIADYASASVDDDGHLLKRNPTPVTRIKLLLKSRSAVYIRLRNSIQSIFGKEKDRSTAVARMYRTDQRETRSELLNDGLDELADWAAARRAEVVLAYTPLTLEQQDGLVESIGTDAGVPTDSTLNRDMIENAADERGWRFVDLSESLRSASEGGVPLSLAGDAHYSEQLSRICAEQLWRQLVATGKEDDRKPGGAPTR